MTNWRHTLEQTRGGNASFAVGAEPATKKPLAIYCDGAVLGNPNGPGGWGMVVTDGADIVHRAHGPLTKRSNNEAEYMAIIQGLAWLNECETPIASATIYSDSQLAVNQINGEWACRAQHLWRLCCACRRLAARLSFRVTFEWTPREGNLEADQEAARGVAEALCVDEEEAMSVLAAQRRKHRAISEQIDIHKIRVNEGDEEGRRGEMNWQHAIKQAQANTVEIVGAEPENTINLDLIRLDGGTQPRATIYDWAVSDYAAEMERGVRFPPVTVFYDGSDYWLADGFHRVHAARQLKLGRIAADIRQGTRRDAVLYSASANATHGLRRMRADKRRAVETLLRDEEWGKWSDREIARRCQVSNTFVGEVRATIRPALTVNVDSERMYMNRYGQESVMRTGSIGKPSESYKEWEGMTGHELQRRELEDLAAMGVEVEVPPQTKIDERSEMLRGLGVQADRSLRAAEEWCRSEEDLDWIPPDEPPQPKPDTPEWRAGIVGRIERLRDATRKPNLTNDYARLNGDYCAIAQQLKSHNKQWTDFISVEEFGELVASLNGRRATHNLIHFGASQSGEWSVEERLVVFTNLGLSLASGDLPERLSDRLRETCSTIIELIAPTGKATAKKGSAK